MLFAVGALPCFLALYLLFAGSVSGSELLAGLPAAALASVLAARLRAVGRRRFTLGPRLIARALADVPRAFATDIVRVASALARGGPGALERTAFREGGPEAPEPGRRAIETLARSLAPNGIVLDIPPGEDLMVLHRLAGVTRRRP